MDEIEMVAVLRTDPSPTPDAVTRHKQQLQTAIAAPSNGKGAHHHPDHQVAAMAVESAPSTSVEDGEEIFDLTLGRSVDAAEQRPRRGRLLAAAAALAVVAGSGALLLSRDDGVEVANSPGSDPLCGTELPFTFTQPGAGFAGPLDGGHPKSTLNESAPPLDGQLVQHWTDDAGDGFELRWPSQDVVGLHKVSGSLFPGEEGEAIEEDATAATTTVPGDIVAAEGEVTTLTMGNMPEGADLGFIDTGAGEDGTQGLFGYTGEIAAPQLGEGQCGTLRLTAVGATDAEAAARFTERRGLILLLLTTIENLETQQADVEVVEAEARAELDAATRNAAVLASVEQLADNSDGGPTIASATATESLPVVAPCETANVPHAGTSEDELGVGTDPDDVLAVLVAARPEVAADSYTGWVLPDMSVAFTAEDATGQVRLVVHVIQTEGQWTLASWESAAC